MSHEAEVKLKHWKSAVLGPALLNPLAYVSCALGLPCLVIDDRPPEQSFQILGSQFSSELDSDSLRAQNYCQGVTAVWLLMETSR